MFANPLDESRSFGFIPAGLSDSVILKTPTIGEITVRVPNNIVVNFEAKSTFVAETIKIKVFGKKYTIRDYQ